MRMESILMHDQKDLVPMVSMEWGRVMDLIQWQSIKALSEMLFNPVK